MIQQDKFENHYSTSECLKIYFREIYISFTLNPNFLTEKLTKLRRLRRKSFSSNFKCIPPPSPFLLLRQLSKRKKIAVAYLADYWILLTLSTQVLCLARHHNTSPVIIAFFKTPILIMCQRKFRSLRLSLTFSFEFPCWSSVLSMVFSTPLCVSSLSFICKEIV